MLNFKATKEEYLTVDKIVKRAVKELKIEDSLKLSMDIIAVHCNDVKLDLNAFLNFEDFNFAPDPVLLKVSKSEFPGRATSCRWLPAESRAEIAELATATLA